jgi:hypothetical protein
MIGKVIFFAVIAYFVYQIVLFFREDKASKKMTGLAIGITILLLTFTGWPLYLNVHLVFSLLTFLYALGMFYECAKEKKGFYFLTAVILLVLSGLQFMEYLGYSTS